MPTGLPLCPPSTPTAWRGGYDVTVATAYAPARSDAQRRGNPEVVEFKTRGNGNLRVGYRGQVQEYRDFVAHFDADVIMCHCWQIWTTDLAYQAFAASTAKKVLISHGVWGKSAFGFPRTIPTWLAWRPYIWRMPRMMRAFDHLVFLTDVRDGDRFYDRLLADRLGLSNVSVIPNGADVQWRDEELPDFRSLYGIGDRPMLLCLANYNKLKNQAMALRAFQRSAAGDAVLVFIGSRMNDYARSLQSQAKQWRRGKFRGGAVPGRVGPQHTSCRLPRGRRFPLPLPHEGGPAPGGPGRHGGGVAIHIHRRGMRAGVSRRGDRNVGGGHGEADSAPAERSGRAPEAGGRRSGGGARLLQLGAGSGRIRRSDPAADIVRAPNPNRVQR